MRWPNWNSDLKTDRYMCSKPLTAGNMPATAAGLTARQVEEAVLSALLLKKSRMAWATPLLRAEMFASADLGFIYRAMTALYERGIQPDMVTTAAEMQHLDPARASQAGGLRPLMGNVVRIRHDDNLPAYVDELRRNFLLRRLSALFATMQGKAGEGTTEGQEIMIETEQAFVALREEMQVAEPAVTLGEVAAQTIEFHTLRMQQPEKGSVVFTGLDEFDDLTGGMHPGELFVGAGRPGDGKSAVALHVALTASKAGKHVCFSSLEMTPKQVMDRYFVGYASVEASHLRKEMPTGREIEQMKRLQGEWDRLGYFFSYTPSSKVEVIRAEAILQQRKGGCDLIVVDYLNMLDSRPGRNETLEQVIASNIRALKALAMEIGCPVLVLAQMNRNIETRSDKMHVPMLSDLRDSGTIEQVADCVFFVYNPSRHGIKEDARTGESLEGVGKLIVAKNRNGSTGVAKYRYNKTMTRLFSDPVLFRTV